MNTDRQAYLDWLRIFAIIGVLFFHSAMPFVAEESWHLKNKETSNLLLESNFFLSRFRMPLLFFISGAVTYFMLRKRTAGAFIALRFKRLFVPLVFGMLTIVPVQVYMERMSGGFKGSFLDFYPTVFTTGSYPKGNFSWHHLWFIAYLFVYDVVLAPVFRCLVLHARESRVLAWLANSKRYLLLILLPAIYFSFTVLRFPQTNDLRHDWCWIVYWLFFLVAGFLYALSPQLQESLQRNRKFSLTLGCISLFIIEYFRWNDLSISKLFTNWESNPLTYLYLSLYVITAWSWVFALVGYGRQYLNKPLRVQGYLNSAVYPFYILHQTVIVVLAYYVIKTDDTILLKYIFLVIATLFVSMTIYHLFIRPFAAVRFLFGGKIDKNQKPLVQKHVNEPLPLPA